MPQRYRRFTDASVSERILDTAFLVTMAIAYCFALLHLYFSHEGLDGKPGISIQDITISYYGQHQQTRLGAAINGPMSMNVRSETHRRILLEWINHGADQDTYQTKVLPVIKSDCAMCHSAGTGLVNLTDYEQISKLAETDTGKSIASLVRLSHIHLFGIALLLFMIGKIFILCEMPVLLKRIIVGIPFLAMLADIFAWYFTKLWPGFAYVVVIAGGLMGLSIMGQIIISIYQMWFMSNNR